MPPCHDQGGFACRARRVFAAALLLALVPAAASADVTSAKAGAAGPLSWRLDDTKITLTGLAGFGSFFVPQANFGAGSYDTRAARDFIEGKRRDAGRPIPSPAWIEAFAKPVLRIERPVGNGDAVFAEASAVYAQTLGDGDAFATSLTRGNPGSADLEQAFIGFRTKPPFGLKGDSLVVQLGPQDFVIDDGFLVQLGKYDVGRAADFYLTPRTAFNGWGTIRLNTDPVRADIFALGVRTDNNAAYGDPAYPVDQPATDFVGFDVEWFKNAARAGADGATNYLDRARYLNLTYLHIHHADNNPVLYGDGNMYWARREGMDVFSVSGGGTLVPLDLWHLRDNATLYFQYVRELNGATTRHVDATGAYVEPGYTFHGLPWSPSIYYRFSYFSGQSGNANTPSEKTSFDPLFYGGGIRDLFGSWGLGEIAGIYLTVNSNLVAHQLTFKVTPPFHLRRPDDSLSIEALLYDFSFDHPEQAGAASSDFAKEADIAIQYAPDSATTVAVAVGVAVPGAGGRQAAAHAILGLPNQRPIGSVTGVAEFYVVRSF